MVQERAYPDATVMLTRSPALVMRLGTPKGRGVFALKSIPAKTVIEICPVIVLPLKDVEAVRSTFLDHYTYNWPVRDSKSGKDVITQAVVLGLGSMFNHSTYHQNVVWERDLHLQCVAYKTMRDIEEGEELCISYGRIWFVNADLDLDTPDGDEADILKNTELP